jgi:hypothetical protein
MNFLVEPQNKGRQVSWLSLKTKVDGFRFGPQNQAGFGLSVAPQNRWREVGVKHALRSSGLLRCEASLARVSQSDLKTGRGAMMGGARDIIVEVALS